MSLVWDSLILTSKSAGILLLLLLFLLILLMCSFVRPDILYLDSSSGGAYLSIDTVAGQTLKEVSEVL